jgi:CRISPR-associated protein Cmr6
VKLPLYREAQGLLQESRCPQDANTGLWYNKMVNKWSPRWELNTAKKDWIETVTGDRCGSSAQITETLQRYIDLVTSLGGAVRVYRTISRFVTGTGNEHPVENGFTWHHTLGTPFLPGSSVKGILRNWAEQWWAESGQSDIIEHLFGPRSGEKSAGNLIVFDALPVKPVQLEIEVMTPHYGPYYQSEGETNPPADWYSPVPIPFLTVAAAQSFVFGLAPRPGTKVDIDLVFGWLDQALAKLGAGAKTASGYGHFQPDKSFKLPERQTRQIPLDDLQPMSPIRQEMEQDGYSSDNRELFMSCLGKWLDRMDDSATSPADRLEIARYLAAWYETHKSKDWQKPNKKSKNFEKVNRIKKALAGD